MIKAEIQAHRGASAYAPENTLESFGLAVEMNADGIELDTHLTKDNVLVVSHDERLGRCAKGDSLISEMTLEELRKVNFNCGMEKYPFAKIPTLAEVYELIKPSRLYINVEIKGNIGKIEPELAKLAKDMKMSERILYSSFYAQALLDIKKLDPVSKCGFLFGDTSGMEGMTIPEYHKAKGFEAVHGWQGALPDEVIAECNDAGLWVNPWTVDEEADMKRLFKAGVHSIITDVPDKARKVLESL